MWLGKVRRRTAAWRWFVRYRPIVIGILLVFCGILSAAPTVEQLEAKIQVLEERIGALDDKEDLRAEADKRDLDSRLQTLQQSSEARQAETEKRVNMYAGGVALLIAVLSFLGYRTVSAWIRNTIKTRVDQEVARVVTSESLSGHIRAQSEKPIAAILKDLEERARSQMAKYDELRQSYEASLTELAQNRMEFDALALQGLSETGARRELNPAISEKLQKFVENLAKAKVEAAYTFDDWYFKAVREYDQRDYAAAAASFEHAVRKQPISVRALGRAAESFERAGQYDNAEEYYKRAIEANPKHADSLCNYASFLGSVRRNQAGAGEYLKRAIDADPQHARSLSIYGGHLAAVQKDPDKAEEYYKRAIEADPTNCTALSRYARFLWNDRRNSDKAEEYYKRAVESDPNDVFCLGVYSEFLLHVRKDYDQVEEHRKRAVELAPHDAAALTSYALFLESVRRDHDKAEEYFRRAAEANPKYALVLSNYAGFLVSVRKDYVKAEEYYKRATEGDERYADAFGNYAQLRFMRGDVKAGTELVARALTSAPTPTLQLECQFYLYAHLPELARRADALRELKKLITSGVRSTRWDLSGTVARAEADGHHNMALLRKLADVIPDKATTVELAAFDEWNKAG
jgi:Tfp pilus assembly protein PilF